MVLRSDLNPKFHLFLKSVQLINVDFFQANRDKKACFFSRHHPAFLATSPKPRSRDPSDLEAQYPLIRKKKN